LFRLPGTWLRASDVSVQIVRNTISLLGTLKKVEMEGNKGIKGKNMEVDEEEGIEVLRSNKAEKLKQRRKLRKTWKEMR
jgi:hypothetical protein